ncbi:hypothetical protein [Sediminibacterium sp.]|uniref:hypothetical protein n=1 Tax=Sediminibacterium sp. TaxID=1917865 RepID=UPI003F6A3D99
MSRISLERLASDNRDTIVRYLENGGDDDLIMLSDVQKKLLDRWRFADEKIREKKYKRETIANFIMAKYNVTRDTAFRDMVSAEYVFSSSAPLNKKYWVGMRIEFLQTKINECYLANDRISAAQLEKVMQKYLEMYPDYSAPKSPKNIIFNFNNAKKTDGDMTVDAAYEMVDEIVKKLENNDDY